MFRTSFGPDDFVLTLWTNDPAVARRADSAGVERVGVDLERLGKRERQHGLKTWISAHTEADLVTLKPQLTTAKLFARVNPLNPDSAREIEAVITAGAAVVMLPMVTSPGDVRRFVEILCGRATAILLVEQREALERVTDLASIDGVDEVHIGLNDLALSLGLTSRWQLLSGELIADASLRVRDAGKRFGFGGIGRARDTSLPIPSDLVYAEYARTGATSALLSRSFTDGIDVDFVEEIGRARRRLAEWFASSPAALAAAHAELAERTRRVTTW